MEKIKDKNINTVEYWNGFDNDAFQNADMNRGGNKCKFLTVIDLIEENKNILDIGCLNGNFYNFLKTNDFKMKSFVGVDLSDKLIDRAKKRFPEQEWLVSDCYRLPFNTDMFDIVTLMEILEHIDNPKLAIEEAKRVCKPGGYIITTTPNEERIKDAAHVWSFRPYDIFSLLFGVSKNVQVLLTCSNNRNIVGKAIVDYKSYF